MSTSTFSQFSNNSSDQEKYNWLTFDDSFKSRPEVLVTSNKAILGLEEDDVLILSNSKLDELGFEHFNYLQSHNNIMVEGAAYKLHISPDRPMKGNGHLVYGINAIPNPAINSEQAFTIALDFMNAESFYWESPEMEQILKQTLNDPEATYLPKAELVFANKDYSQIGADYKLAWKFDISSFGEKGRKIVFVNANDGAILYALEGHMDDAVEGSGNTRYAGLQSFITDSVSEGLYVLKDDTRGGGIHTWNLETSTNYGDRVDFTDDDNFWDNTENADDAALDVHWGMQETYDYFLNEHGRDSYNDNGGALTVYVHYDNNWFNAQWTGNGVMRFGDGGNDPLTAIDVASHELTHGVTEYTAGLIYQNESGALNESYSDVFGTAVEFYALGEEGDWIIGTGSFALRSMSNPKSFGDPDTYQGDNWNFGSSDNGGVHTNSGVQNHWYYLLSVGGSGVNDNGDAYNVEGIGMEAASAIAYRNLAVYLNQSSNYNAARMGALNSAEDIYGECSIEALQTLNAWYAVGLGSPEFFIDVAISEVLSPVTGCGFGSEEFLSVEILNIDNTWCSADFPAGTKVHFGYNFDGGENVLDSTVLASALNIGEYLEFTFSEPVDMTNQGDHNFNIWVKSPTFTESEPFAVLDHLVGNKTVLDDGVVIGFEDTDFSPDSFAVFEGVHADARISISADNTGSRGFRMTGYDVDYENIEFVIPDNEEDNFILNPEYGSKICFCVGAAEWDYVRLVFDLQQTHSQFYMEEYGQDFPNFVSSMRIMIDDVQIGDQYHPITYEDDPYLTHIIDLDSYAGTDFDLCFESKTFLSKVDDPVSGSDGDNTYLDNIGFFNATVGVEELEQGDFNISPNPSDGVFNVDFSANLNGKYYISVIDVLGREIYSNQNVVKASERIRIDISNYPKGMYSVILRSESNAISKKIVLE